MAYIIWEYVNLYQYIWDLDENFTSIIYGVNLTIQDLLRQDARIQDLYFNISEMKLSITSLYVISDAPKCDIIMTETSVLLIAIFRRY